MDDLKEIMDIIKGLIKKDEKRDWKSLYLGEFNDSMESNFHEIVKEYHERTESFDRIVCTGEIRNGEILPANGYELQLMNYPTTKDGWVSEFKALLMV